MLIHHYDNHTGQYCGSQLADADPRSPGRWLLPAFATAEVLPERTAESWPFFRDGAWVLLPDFRGKVLYRTDTGEKAEIVAPGIRPQDIGLTLEPRPSNDHVWKDGIWQLSAEQVTKRARDEAMAVFNGKMEIARQANAGKADAYAAGLLSDVEIAVFKAWATYQMDLVRALSAPAFPESIDWPHEPDVEAVTANALAEQAAAEQLENELAAAAATIEATTESAPEVASEAVTEATTEAA